MKNEFACTFAKLHVNKHELWTPNEGINQRNLKIWANVAGKIYSLAFPKNLEVGVDLRPCSEEDFLNGRP